MQPFSLWHGRVGLCSPSVCGMGEWVCEDVQFVACLKDPFTANFLVLYKEEPRSWCLDHTGP